MSFFVYKNKRKIRMNININSIEITYIMMIESLENKIKMLEKISKNKDEIIFLLKTQLNEKEK